MGRKATKKTGKKMLRPLDVLFTEDEVAARLKVCKETVGRYARRGIKGIRLKRTMLGSDVRYTESDIAIFIELTQPRPELAASR